MPRKSAADRIERLEALTSLLRQEGYCQIGDLADRLNVNSRTIARDLEILRSQGMPIESERGRGGGIQLNRHWGIGRVNLDLTEAVDLLVSLAVAEQMNSPIFLANIRSIRRKLVASLSPDKQLKVHDLKSRILIGQSASTVVLGTFESANRSVVQTLHQAFVTKQSLTIHYHADGGKQSKREVEPHYLLLHYPVWYVLAWDRLRDAPRTFRCDRIKRAHRTDKNFSLRRKDTFSSSIEGSHLI